MVLRSVVAFAAALLAGSAFGASRDENLANPIVGVEDAVLTDAPNVPPPIHRSHATKVVVHLEVRELEGCGLDPATGKGYSTDSGLWKGIAHQKSGWIAPHRLRYAASFKWLFSRQTDKRDR